MVSVGGLSGSEWAWPDPLVAANHPIGRMMNLLLLVERVLRFYMIVLSQRARHQILQNFHHLTDPMRNHLDFGLCLPGTPAL